MIVCFRESEVLKSIVVGILVMVHGMSASPQPFPSKNSNPEKKYSLTFKDGLSYANYAGAGLSIAAIVKNHMIDNDSIPVFFPLYIAGAALNILSAKVDPEKNPKSNIALIGANAVWGLAHIGLTELFVVLKVSPIITIYFGIKGAINIANAVYRVSVATKKK